MRVKGYSYLIFSFLTTKDLKIFRRVQKPLQDRRAKKAGKNRYETSEKHAQYHSEGAKRPKNLS
ncbi:MAG: hypothetical protein A3E19_04550 [Planctomycetes bacterium RIFCSPHIGHO2_12_FULL_52_36]|nr:MAG: hypothetical protein A3E19_04550 [Planctomycetes bacterium RIFCSPHIGHO2_12_FULL_52_36]